MALYKDGNVYRTYDEQVDHLTKAHREQLIVNQNVSDNLAELNVASNLGGYNLVRFAFEKSGTYYQIGSRVTANLIGNIGDFVEINTGNELDIPAYGYYVSEHDIRIDFRGDFTSNYSSLNIRNVNSQQENAESFEMYSFTGTSLLDYDPNENKKQIFNVLTDLAYNTGTQYASFDLNRDGKYSFVFIGVDRKGRDGYSIYSTNGINTSVVVNKTKVGDTIVFANNNTDTTSSLPDSLKNALKGDIFVRENSTVWYRMGNIRGQQGIQGIQGPKGDQGIQGVQGIQGPQGEKGDKGDKGDPGDQGILIFTGVLNSPDELPAFSSTEVGDAYRVINTSGSIVTYDLYFHAVNGTDWDIQPNWGGVKGDKGDKGDQGPQGIQGIQGPQGPQGIAGGALHAHRIFINISLSSKAQIYINGTLEDRAIAQLLLTYIISSNSKIDFLSSLSYDLYYTGGFKSNSNPHVCNGFIFRRSIGYYYNIISIYGGGGAIYGTAIRDTEEISFYIVEAGEVIKITDTVI